MAPHLHTKRIARTARLACVAGLATALALSGGLALPRVASGATAQTMSELSRLQGEVSAAASTFAEASARAGELQAQVDEAATEILAIEQEAMPAAQSKASTAVSNLYKMHANSSGMLALLLNADSFESLLSLNKYLGTIQSNQIDALAELNELEDKLNAKLEELGEAKDEAESELQRASAALSQVQSAAAQMQKKANAENAAEAEAARKAAEQAAALAEQHQQQTGGGSNGNAEQEDPGTTAPEPPAQSEPQNPSSPSEPAEPSKPSEQPSNPSGGWLTGVASHYGTGDGFMGGMTASGEIVTETSMGIAMLNVPFGTRVEIRYGGRSVIAYVNDRGPYVHGRVIDMQPAVARALNFINVGVGTVQYRFL